jgi:hypothetical protein
MTRRLGGDGRRPPAASDGAGRRPRGSGPTDDLVLGQPRPAQQQHKQICSGSGRRRLARRARECRRAAVVEQRGPLQSLQPLQALEQPRSTPLQPEPKPTPPPSWSSPLQPDPAPAYRAASVSARPPAPRACPPGGRAPSRRTTRSKRSRRPRPSRPQQPRPSRPQRPPQAPRRRPQGRVRVALAGDGQRDAAAAAGRAQAAAGAPQGGQGAARPRRDHAGPVQRDQEGGHRGDLATARKVRACSSHLLALSRARRRARCRNTHNTRISSACTSRHAS